MFRSTCWGLSRKGGLLPCATRSPPIAKFGAQERPFWGKRTVSLSPGSRPAQNPLLARSSKGLTGWVTKYPLRGDVAKAKWCAIASNYPRGDRGCVPPVDRAYTSVQLTVSPGPSCFDSGPEPRPRRYADFRIVTAIICTQSGRSRPRHTVPTGAWGASSHLEASRVGRVPRNG